MSKTTMVLVRIAGGVIGSLVGGWLLFVGECFVVGQMAPDDDTGVGLPVVIFLFALAFLLGAIPGAIVGAMVGKKLLRQWSVSSSSRMQGVISPSDTLKLQPGQARCPFCHSTVFRVEEEAGSRRCSNCRSVLPNYIHGTR